MARIYDLTPPLRAGFAGWPGDPAFAIAPALTIAEHGAAVSRLTLGTHTGAHVDAPAHLIPGGATAGELPLAALIGPAWVAAWQTTSFSNRRTDSGPPIIGSTPTSPARA